MGEKNETNIRKVSLLSKLEYLLKEKSSFEIWISRRQNFRRLRYLRLGAEEKKSTEDLF